MSDNLDKMVTSARRTGAYQIIEWLANKANSEGRTKFTFMDLKAALYAIERGEIDGPADA